MDQIKTDRHDAIILSSNDERELQKRFVEKFKAAPLPDDEILPNLGLFMTSKALSRVLFFYEIYQKIIHTHGVVMEFGVRWGQTLSIMSALRGIFEPFNRHRKVIGFDTFSGFAGVSEKDGTRSNTRDGSFSVAPMYQDYLGEILDLQEKMNPIPHLKKHELVQGDVAVTLPDYLARHPETMVSLAIFDLDIYAPTKAALQAIQPHLFKGSVLVFDELCDDILPGETLALRETLGLRDLRVQRLPMTARVSYVVLE